jgi:hypothetical protein
MNNLKQQGVASQMYQDDNDAYFLAIYEDMKGTGIKYWCENMAPYTNTRNARRTIVVRATSPNVPMCGSPLGP